LGAVRLRFAEERMFGIPENHEDKIVELMDA